MFSPPGRECRMTPLFFQSPLTENFSAWANGFLRLIPEPRSAMSPDGSGMSPHLNPPRAPYPFAAVLFDMDGVIVDNTALHRQIWEEFLRRHGFEPTVGDLRAAALLGH